VTVKKVQIIFILTISFSIFSSSYAQDEFEELTIDSVTNCAPESLNTIYDQYKQDDLDIFQIKKWYSFGSEYFKQEEYTSALPYLWKVFVNDTTKYGYYAIRKIADCYYSLRLTDSTLWACYRGLKQFPELENLHYYAGFIQVNYGKLLCAIPHYEMLVEKNPKNESFLDKLAFLYFKNNDETAIEIQKRLVEFYPTNLEYQKRLIIYLEHFNYDPLEEIRVAFGRDSTNVENAKRLGKAEYEAGNYEQALTPITTALKFDSANVALLKLRAQCFEGLTKYVSAINDYKTILKYRPDDIDIMCAIATQYKLLNKFGKGAYWAKKAAKHKPVLGLPYIVMAEIYEASVPYCQSVNNRGRKIDDGLVYEKAIAQYEIAKQDPAYAAYAKRRIKLLEPYLPTTEELFFSPEKKLKYGCYTSWIED